MISFTEVIERAAENCRHLYAAHQNVDVNTVSLSIALTDTCAWRVSVSKRGHSEDLWAKEHGPTLVQAVKDLETKLAAAVKAKHHEHNEEAARIYGVLIHCGLDPSE